MITWANDNNEKLIAICCKNDDVVGIQVAKYTIGWLYIVQVSILLWQSTMINFCDFISVASRHLVWYITYNFYKVIIG